MRCIVRWMTRRAQEHYGVYDVASMIALLVPTTGLHSSTFRLNVSTFCGIRRVHDFPPVY